MSRLLNYLTEKTFALDKDVDFLYKNSKVDELFNYVKNKDFNGIFNFIKTKQPFNGGVTFFKTDSSQLKNRNSKQAHKINPVKIRIGSYPTGSYYDIKNKIIQISIHSGALDLVLKNKGDVDNLKGFLGKQFDRFLSEFSIPAFKGTIIHELTHWIDDSLHNNHMENKFAMAAERGEFGSIKGKHNDVNHTEFEVNSQIHAMKVIRRELGKREFDKLNWETFFKTKASFVSNFNNFRNEEEFNTFIKSFVSRLHREKLLPKGMQNIPTWGKMKYILANV